MKKIFLVILLQLSFVLSAQQNIIPNGGFETYRGGRFTGWLLADSFYFERSTDAHSGRYSLKVWANGTSFTAVKANTNQPNVAEVEAGAEYDFSYWYKGDTQNSSTGNRDKNVVVNIFWYKDDERVKTESFTNDMVEPSPTIWQEKKLKLNAPLGVNRVGVSFRIQRGAGYILIDDISMVFKKSGSVDTLPTPTKFVQTAYQREIELAWDKEADPEIQWEVVLNDNAPIKVATNSYIIEGLEPNSSHRIKIRAVKGNLTSEYTQELRTNTQRLGYNKEDLNRVPYLRTINNDMRCPQILHLYYTDLADKNAKIRYFIDGTETALINGKLHFPKKGKQKLKVIIEESETLQWETDYEVDVQ